MMDEINKNELNEQEMENVAGGAFFSEPKSDCGYMEYYQKTRGTTVGEYLSQEIYDAVSEPVSTAWEVVKYALEKNFLK